MVKLKDMKSYISMLICLIGSILLFIFIKAYQPMVHTVYLLAIVVYFIDTIYEKRLFKWTSIVVMIVSLGAFYANFGFSDGNLSKYGWTALFCGLAILIVMVFNSIMNCINKKD